jgi:Zn-dependent protease
MELTIIQKIAIWALPLIFAITLHEVAHGYVASLFGDQTARLSGRLSLNPIKHIDPLGTIILPLIMLTFSNFIFGWAKPVPVDERNLHHPRRDMAIVALAGPLSNLLMALFWGLIAKVGIIVSHSGNTWIGEPLTYMGGAGILINALLAVLNLIPLPPLDGGKVLAAVLPRRAAYHYNMIEPYGFVILILLLFSGFLSYIISPALFLSDIIASIFGLIS